MVGGIQFGATEQLLLIYTWHIIYACQPKTNALVREPFDVKGTLGFDPPIDISMTFLLSAGASFIPAF